MFVVLVSNLATMRAAGYAVFAPKSAPALAGNCCHVLRSEAECTFYHVFHVEFCADAKCNDSLDAHTWFAYSEDLTKAAPLPRQAIEIRSEMRSEIRSETRSDQSPAATFPSYRSSQATQVVPKDLFFGRICVAECFSDRFIVQKDSSFGRILFGGLALRMLLSSRENGSPAASTRQFSSRAGSC